MFSPLENKTMLTNNIKSFDKNPPPLEHVGKIVNRRLTNPSIEPDSYDVEIKVGANRGDIKTFKAHSNILKESSSHFKAALSTDWIKKSKDGIILLEEKNISPKIFE